MPRRARVPEELSSRPFSVAEALAGGLTRRQLESKVWVRLHQGVYVHRDVDLDDRMRLAALHLAAPAGVAFAGLTAAWLHGLWVPPPGQPVPLVTTRGAAAGGLDGTEHLSRRQILRAEDEDVVEVGGVFATSPRRTPSTWSGTSRWWNG